MIRISKILLGFIAACLLLIPACTEPMYEGVEGGVTNATALKLSLSVDRMGLEIATRASMPGTTDENTVSTMHLFFFEPSNDGSGGFVDVIKLENTSGLPKISDIPAQNKAISTANAYRVIGVANADAYMEAGWDAVAKWEGKNENYFRQNSITKDVTTFTSSNLLMNGSAVKTAGNGLIEMKLTRNVVRVDVALKDDPLTYELQSVQLRNVFVNSSITGDATTIDYTSSNTDDRKHGVEISEGIVNHEIKGKLYAFENKVVSPLINDKVTTCLIVKLGCTENNQKCGYFRININPKGQGQNLLRNNVYSISINKVLGEGYDSADKAYNGTKENELEYTINNWDLDDNGLIVSDSYSILALPVKVAQIGKDGGTFNYSITTFSTLESPTPLQVKSQTGDSEFIVSLTGNTLTITALALDDENQIREGSVTLSYAGLEATMKIEQSLKANAFLKLTYEDGWSGLFGSSGNEESKKIFVNASGPWTATVIGEEDRFLFGPNPGTQGTISKTNPNDNFTILCPFENNERRRIAFVVVTLDADPIHCVGVVSLVQTVSNGINISPVRETVTFNGSQSVTSVPESNVFTFTNVSCYETIEENDQTVQKPVALVAEIIEGGDKFACSLSGLSTGYTLKIWTRTANNTSSNFTGKVKISGGGSELVINLIQYPLTLSVSVTHPTEVGPEGGDTGEFNLLTGDPNATWKASVVTRGVNGTIFKHEAQLVYANGSPVGQYDILTAITPIKVRFPKVLFPNREIDIQATVTFETTSGGAKAMQTFKQRRLAARGVNIWNLRGSHYGSLSGSHYIDKYRDAIRAFTGTFNNNTAHTPPSSYPGGTTYIHVGNQFTSAFNWTAVNSFLTKEDGIVVLTNDEGGTSLKKGNELLSVLGYSNAIDPKKTPSITVASGTSSSRVGLFMTTYGKTPISNPGGIPKYYSNSILTYMPSSSSGLKTKGGTGVALLTSNNDTEVYLMVDPAKKFVYIGEIEVFNHEHHLTQGRKDFMNNFVQYVANAAKYGSHFTDMLREDGVYNNITPMWHEDWGTNRWPLRSN